MSTKILIAGGGTGGHIFPGLALAEALLRLQPAAELLFVGSNRGLEKRLVPDAGFRLQTIDVGSLKGAGWRRRATTLAGLPLAVSRAWRILSRFRPDVVVGLGGYASAPTIVAARGRRCRTLLLEQNSIPGLTNRMLARLTQRIVISYPEAAQHLPAGRSICLGNPLRHALVSALTAARPAHKGIRLLVLGGSQGASAVNRLVADAAPIVAQMPGLALSIQHQTGKNDAEWVNAHYETHSLDARVDAFVEDMTTAYQAADLVIGRSGATTLAEVAVAGLPAILIPYPFAADDHQAHNAAHFVDAGAALMVPQEALDADKLATMIGDLVRDDTRRAAMAAAMKRCAKPQASDEIAQLVLALAQQGTP